MLTIRLWNGAMAVLTFLALTPYFTDIDAAMARDGLSAISPEGSGRVLVAFGLQGVAMGLYCLWGAIIRERAVEALRFLTLYMACVSIGRAIAAVGFFSDLGSQPVVYFALDTLITIISAVIFFRYTKAQKNRAEPAENTTR